jgi:histidinol-phosphate aminotransferase
MNRAINPAQEADFARRGFSRREFPRIASLLTAGAALPFYNEPALAQRGRRGADAPDAVRIDANENPMGPCPEAAEAIHAMVQKGGRYLVGESSRMASVLAEQEGLSASYVQPFAGSSDALHRTILSFCGKDRPYIFGNPGYEAGGRAAQFVGAGAIGVPLTEGGFAHDVRKMAAAHAAPGVFYICNPNNPTGTVTPKADIEWLVNSKPAGSVVLLDEAYIHFSRSAEKSSYLVAAGKDLIILRTFSKLYGMAGLRAGAALARPDLLRKIGQYTGTGFLPITGMAGATASLLSKTVIAERRKIYDAVRRETFEFLAKRNIEFIPSEANMFMMNVKRPAQAFAQAMSRQGVIVGRVWPVWPTWVRVTVGSPEDMAKFREACAASYEA